MEKSKAEMPPSSSVPAMWHVGCIEEAGAVWTQVNQRVRVKSARDRVA